MFTTILEIYLSCSNRVRIIISIQEIDEKCANYSCDVGSLPENKMKNRTLYILPCKSLITFKRCHFSVISKNSQYAELQEHKFTARLVLKIT